MNILIDIGHPGHVHLFKNLYFELKKNGHRTIVTVKNVPIAIKLLTQLNIPFINIGSKKDSISKKVWNQVKFNCKTWNIVKKNNIDIGIGTSFSLAHVSIFSKMESVILDDDDDEVQPLFVKYAHPFAHHILSPSALIGHRKSKKTIFYSGYHELAYLHPNRFQPDEDVLKEIGLSENDPFFVLRFNVFKAHHDIGVKGLNLEQKLQIIELLKPHGKIFITTEREIEPELKEFQLPVSPEKIHSLLYFATMFIGDSQTMTSEAAVLGTPAIRLNSFVGRIAYLEEEEHKYGLTYGFTPDKFGQMLEKIEELLNSPNLKLEWQKRRRNMLHEKIDVTAFMVWFIENYPESVKIMKINPDYQYRFK